MINFEFNEKAYQKYLSNTRIRPEGMSFIGVVIEGQKIMESTKEGGNPWNISAISGNNIVESLIC
jgi:hypothetical protein